MDLRIPSSGMSAGLLCAALCLPFGVCGVPGAISGTWRWPLPLGLCLALCLLALLPPVWAGARAAGGAVDLQAARARGAWAGAMCGVVVFVLAGGASICALSCVPLAEALRHAPLKDLAFVEAIAAPLELGFGLTALGWLVLPTGGAALGAWGASRSGAAPGERAAPTLAATEATLWLCVALVQSALCAVATVAALPKMMGEVLGARERYGALDSLSVARAAILMLPAVLTVGANLAVLLGVLHGGAARAVVGWGRGWERLPRLLALVVFLLTLLVLAVVGGEHGPAIAAVTGAVALGASARVQSTGAVLRPLVAAASVQGWVLSGAVGTAWLLSPSLMAGVAALPMVGLLPALSGGVSGPWALDEQLAQALAVLVGAGAVTIAAAAVGTGLWVGLPMAIYLFFRRG